MLSQNIDGQERVIAFASRTLTKSERRYCVTRKELLALVHFVKYFRHYLYGKKFKVRTDHGSLRWLMKFKNPEGQIARWLEVLSSYDMNIVHRPGRMHQNADGLSRVRCEQCGLDNSETVVFTNSGEATAFVNQIDAHEITSLREAQEADPQISKVLSWVKSGKKPETKTIDGESYFVKSLVKQWQRLHNETQLACEALGRSWDKRCLLARNSTSQS